MSGLSTRPLGLTSRRPDSLWAVSVPVLVAVAWPYASGSRHLGHLAGAYLPADIYARHQRLVGNDVLMVSGSDVHGTPITVRADAEGVTPAEIVGRYHSEFCRQWEQLGISWDLFTTTGTPNHAEVTQDMFLVQLRNGHMDKRVSEQFYDPVGRRFLPDRYIEGTCPHCGFGQARGDQCEHCSTTLDATDLIEPRSKISGAVPELRQTEHFYYRYSDFTEAVAAWLKTRQGWRPHVLNSCTGWTNEGLHDRAITRDLDWGVELPVDDLGEGKRIYVWYDAVIGYLSASKEWSQRRGEPDAWKRWWHNDDAHHVYFMAKDNIPFHCLFWPAQLMGYGGLHLPDNVPANQYVTFSGAKMAAGRGIGLTVDVGLDLFEPDALRYALAAALPEHADTEISIEEIARRVNDELVATWGNLVNRVLSMAQTTLGGSIPAVESRRPEDLDLLAAVDAALVEAGARISQVELRAGLRTAMDAAARVNGYLNATEPWKLAAADPERASAVLVTALEAIAGVRTALSPYLPFSTAALDDVFGPVTDWHRPEVPAGLKLAKPSRLFSKVDLDKLALDAPG